MRTFEIVTLGCKVNEYETQFYEQQLQKAGFSPKEKGQEKSADVILVNTCTVTNTAAAKSRQKIRKARKENPEAKVVVCGCYAQTMEPETAGELEADLLIGASHKNETAELILDLFQEEKNPGSEKHTVSMVRPIEEIHDFESMPIGHFEGQHRAFLKIQDGCNQYCAYCQIPLARGPERSQIPEEIIRTARELAEHGHQEIVLTGIHTGRYHFRGTDLADLLEVLLKELPETVSFRISSIEITEVSDRLIKLMKENPRILHHLHIPVQSASNPTLARMKRPYTVEMFKDRLAEIRKEIPDISISTDVICGFVQESQEEFEDTVRNLEEMQFSFLHVFPYSRRKGTAADQMKGFVDSLTVKERTKQLLQLSDTLRFRDMKRFSESDVLAEREDPRHPGWMSGYTVQYHPVRIRTENPLSGRVHVRLDGIEDGVYLASVSE